MSRKLLSFRVKLTLNEDVSSFYVSFKCSNNQETNGTKTEEDAKRETERSTSRKRAEGLTRRSIRKIWRNSCPTEEATSTPCSAAKEEELGSGGIAPSR